jgi:hypothetical protein
LRIATSEESSQNDNERVKEERMKKMNRKRGYLEERTRIDENDWKGVEI